MNDSKQGDPAAMRQWYADNDLPGPPEFTSPPPMPINSTIVCVMAARGGRFYAAPIGTDATDLNASDSWTSVSSLAELADLLSVQWTPPGRDPRG